MKCDDCEYYYFARTHDGRNNRPACRKGFVPYVDVHCNSFKELEISEAVIEYLMTPPWWFKVLWER